MSKFKVGDKVWCNGEIKVIARIDEWADNEFGYYFDKNDDILDFYEEHDLELYKSPHERLLDMGFIGQEPFSRDYRLYKKGTFVNIVIISFNIKDKDYVIWKQDDEVSIEEIYPVNLELANVLIDYLKELENENTNDTKLYK